jgi:hypothetical protein
MVVVRRCSHLGATRGTDRARKILNLWLGVGMKTDWIRSDITNIIFVFIFPSGFEFEYEYGQPAG